MNLTKLRSELSRDEGRKLRAYKDSLGYWTIGVGHLLGSSPRMSDITEAECDALLDADIEVAYQSVKRVFPEARLDTGHELLVPVRVRALVNMMFNRGEGRMKTSTSITPAIKAAILADTDHDIMWKRVTEAIKKSEWASQVGARATRLAHMLETGEDA